MSCSNLIAVNKAATGAVLASPGRVGGIYGNVTTAGRLKLYDGSGTSDKLVLDIGLATGNANLELPGSFFFRRAIYAEFTGSLAGTLTFVLV